MAMRELQGLLPAVKQSKLLHSLIVKERFATFSPCVGVEDLRPTASTPVRGLYLAGDWTATGLPATIEGAVKSGYTAAEELLQNA
jgi:zeta-carotene desaturase